MPSDEFSIIDRYFSNVGRSTQNIPLSIGDDAAVVELPSNSQLVVTMDTLVAGVHFPKDTSPSDVAYKALAVNLSDLAAMAAEPAWFLMSLTMPDSDEDWLDSFSATLKLEAEARQIKLIGGDTCRGPLSISIQMAGLVPNGTYVSRANAQPGDLILVSGELGNAALGLAEAQNKIRLPQDLSSLCQQALSRPQPRLELRPFLRDFASAAIDLSDGLQGDLGHILKASGTGAEIEAGKLPVNHWIKQHEAYEYALAGGDDYEICCCVAASKLSEIEAWNNHNPACRLTIIGKITESNYRLLRGKELIDLSTSQGFQHFE